MARVSIQQYGDLDDTQRQGIQEIDYGAGKVATRQGSGFQYGWIRPEAYQDALGAQDIGAQEQEYAFRAGNPGAKLPEDSAGLAQTMQQGIQPAPANATPAQQWNAQPAAQPMQANPQAPALNTGGELMRLLMERAQQGQVGRDDPNVRTQTDAYSAQVERAKRNYLGDLAEREGPYANLRGEQRMAAERAGQQVGGFEAELIGREQEARREEIMQYMQMWGAMLSGDQRMALERELAQLNDQARTADRGLSRYGMDQTFAARGADRNQQMDQFLRELALREWGMGEDNDFRWATL